MDSFTAKYQSVCSLCDGQINPGDQVRRVEREVTHYVCPKVGKSASQGENHNIGKVACDGVGNVLAVMTKAGWTTPDSSWPQLERRDGEWRLPSLGDVIKRV